MGAMIAAELLRRGCTVRVFDDCRARSKSACKILRQLIGRTSAQTQHVYAQLNRFSVATDLEHLLSDGFTFVIEAITEDLAAKQVLFHRIALILKRKNVPPCEVLLCSNTISVPLHLIAAVRVKPVLMLKIGTLHTHMRV